MAPGSVVEPGTVKRFKSRLNDDHIVDVSQQDFDKWHKYFKERIGVELASLASPPLAKARSLLFGPVSAGAKLGAASGTSPNWFTDRS